MWELFSRREKQTTPNGGFEFTKIGPKSCITFRSMKLFSSAQCSHRYPGSTPLFWPDFELHSGSIVALQGPSGCGKSTALHAVGGLLSIDSGVLELHGRGRLTPGISPPADWRQKWIGWIPQRPFFWPGFTVRENLEMTAWAKKTRIDSTQMDALERLGMSAFWNHRADRLSLGQQQRLSAVRATLGSPKILLADEPTASLDDLHAREVMDLLQNWCTDRESAILLASHDARTQSYPAERVLFETYSPAQ